MSSDHESPWDYAAVGRRITEERLSPYLAEVGGDLHAAFRLYEWNIRASSAVLATIAMTEVVVRNALDEQLHAWVDERHPDGSWLDLAPLDARGRKDVKDARQYAARSNKTAVPPHGKVVAELGLGFWRYLTASRYLTDLWIPALHRAFPIAPHKGFRPRRAAVEERLERLLLVRNRAAHHEPIFRRDLTRDAHTAIELVGWICRDSAAWIDARDTIRAAMSERPNFNR
jgi:hypothetical protein